MNLHFRLLIDFDEELADRIKECRIHVHCPRNIYPKKYERNGEELTIESAMIDGINTKNDDTTGYFYTSMMSIKNTI